ncbi:MAG: radical SAM family heme chaperone HemW [Acidobacteria bacterium]|nr:radical SAM family heme chaperone HemW [Acidobacteriota bacterium]
MLGIYVHIPFCSAICNYCNFNRGLFEPGLKERYVSALLTEIRQEGDGSRADTIFFGGGTPSLLEPFEIEAVIDACAEGWDLNGDTEITLEANPETVTPERLAGFRGAGVNRLSYGVQSFRDDELVRLSRLHSSAKAAEAFAMARAAGFDNISLDLMMWLPQQAVSQWLESVDALIALGPDHASLYMLEIYPNAPLRDAMARGRWSVAPEDDVAEMYLAGLGRMDSAGYEQYEISNVARPGRQARHNLKYWTDGEWIGLGCGAHSTRSGTRWKNLSDTEDYISAVERGTPTATDRRVLSADQRLEDALFTGLRLNAGLDVGIVRQRYGVDVWARYGEQFQPFLDRGLLSYDGSSLRLPREGMLVAHEMMAVFIG